jgi:diguanylate cyclase (GGDEF)-like protein
MAVRTSLRPASPPGALACLKTHAERPRELVPGSFFNDVEIPRLLESISGAAQDVDEVLEGVARLVERQIQGSGCVIVFERHARKDMLPRKLPLASSRLRNREVGAGQDLIALAHSVNTKQFVQSSSWSLKTRSKYSRVGGKVVLTISTPKPIGATDASVIQAALRLAAMAIEYRALNSVVNSQATTDRATGLPNRDAFQNRLARLLRKGKSRSSAAVVWVNCEKLKDVDEGVGYGTINALLRAVGRRIISVVGEGAWLARTGAHDFAVACEGPAVEDVSTCAERILAAFETPLRVNRYEFLLHVRIGIAVYPEHAASAPALQQKAANASLLAGTGTTSRYTFYEDGPAAGAREKFQIEHDLRRAIDNDELQLVYQPQVGLNGRFVGVEALIRWDHPNRGLLTPDKFIPVAEETGLIMPIGAWVIREACRRGAEWNRVLDEPVKVSVNVSPLQLYCSDLPDIIRSSLHASGLPAKCFGIELTETTIMQSADEAAKSLEKIRAFGVTVAIDDFGTGYSSLGWLQKLPFDVLKIDRSFLQPFHAGATGPVLPAITALGHSLQLQIVAEGVETREQWDGLRRIGVDIVQGLIIAGPMPPGPALEWMRQHTTDDRCRARWSE